MKLFSLKSNIPFILIAVIVLLIFLHYVGILSPLENIFIRIVSPIQFKLYSLAVIINEKVFNITPPANDLQQQNKILQRQINDLVVENAKLRVLEDENTLLSKQLNLVENINLDYVTCKVIGRQFDKNSNILILNCGRKQGIKDGLAAIVSDDIIVGKIIDVESNLSRLLLLNSNTSKIGGTILNLERTTGIITGTNDSSLIMEFIPHDVEINIGDLIVTSSLEKNMMKDLVVGRVENVDSPSNSFFQSADISPIVNFETVSIVTIFLPLDI